MKIQPDYNGTVNIILQELDLGGTGFISPHDPMGSRIQDSVAAAAFMGRLSQRLHRVVPLTVFWAYPSAAELAGYLTDLTPAPARSPVNEIKAERAATLEPIAIVGLACRLPGAGDAAGFRRLLRAGRCAVGPVPDGRLIGGAFHQRWGNPLCRGGFLPDVAGFDRRIFGISRHESRQMDPQQKLVLEAGWSAIEDAGLDPHSLKQARGGVFIGAMWNDFAHYAVSGEISAHSATGMDLSIISARLSFLLGLSGPALTINTACSSSLVAIHLACQSLRAGECEFALAGGVNVILSEHSNAAMHSLGVISPSGACHAFAAQADGYARAEGCGILLLKPLCAALRDDDPIYGTVCASGVNNNGDNASLTAPSARAQEILMREVCRQGGISPGDVDYLEAHGTGTLLGDPIEAAAAAKVYCQGQNRTGPLIVGSVKANIGHCEAASGVAGLIKILLAMHDGEIPSQANFHHPNPHIDLAELGITIPRQRVPWPAGSRGRLAALSSFGFGGTNAHAIIADTWQSRHHTPPSTHHTLSAGKAGDAAPGGCKMTANTGAAVNNSMASAFSGAAVNDSMASTVACAAAIHPGMPSVAGVPGATLVFSGQGSHWTSMGLALAGIDPVFRSRIKACDGAVGKLAGWSLAQRLYSPKEDFTDIRIAWPCHLAIQLGIADIWQSRGLAVTAVLGHSIGELAAAHWAGMLSLEEAFAISLAQAEWAAGQHGMMALIGLDWSRTGALLKQTGLPIDRAIQHQEHATVVSGSVETMAALRSACKAQRIDFAPVNSSAAVHRPVTDWQGEKLEAALPKITAAPPAITFYSAMAGGDAATGGLPWTHWRDLLIKPLYWCDHVNIVMAGKRTVFVEISPHPVVLSTLLRDNGERHVAVASARKDQFAPKIMDEAIALLSRHGFDLSQRTANSVQAGTGPLQRQSPPKQAFWLLPVSARCPDVLGARCAQLAALLEDPAVSLSDLCFTLAARTAHYAHRAAFVVAEKEEAIQALRGFNGETARADIASSQTATSKRVGLLCSARHWISSEDLAVLIEQPVFRLTYKRGQRALQNLSISDSSGVGAAFLQQISLAALLFWYGAGRAEFIGTDEGGVIAAHLHGDLTLSDAIAQLRRNPDRPATHVCPGEQAEAILAAARENHLKAIMPLTLDIHNAAIPDGDTALAVSRCEQWFKPGAGPVHKRLLGLLGSLYTLGSIADLRRLGGQGDKIILPEPPWRHDNPIRPRSADANGEGTAPGKPPINLYELQWIAAPRAPAEPDRNRAGENNGEDNSDDASGYAGAGRMIFADPALAKQLTARGVGAQAIWVACGDRYHDHGNGHNVTVNPADPDHLSRLLERYPVIKILYLRSLSMPTDEDLPARPVRGLRKAADGGFPARFVLEPLLHLIRALATKNLGDTELCLVTAGCQPVGGIPVNRPEPALLWGLARTLRLEHPEINCRIIDIDPSHGDIPLSENALTGLLRGISGYCPVESAWRGEQCHVPALAVCPGPPPERLKSTYISDSTGFYLISGGLGAFGLHLAHWLIDRGIKNIVLMGRKGADATTGHAVAGLEQRGARIGTYAADVANLTALQNVVSHAEAAFGPLNGIIHGAGLFRGGFLQHDSAAIHYEVMRPKIEGAMNLHHITRQRPVREFILISSASSVLGLSRYAGYAAANACLDALAWMRRGSGLPALSIGFGPFSDAGLALSEAALMNSSRLPALTMTEGIGWLSRALAAGMTHGIAMAYDAPAPAHGIAKVYGAPERFTQDMAGAVLPAKTAPSHTALSSAPPGQRAARVMSYLRRQAADLAGCDGERLSDRLPLRDAGIDSLTGVELRNRLQREFCIPLPVTLLWDYPTLAELTVFILNRVQMNSPHRENRYE
ncbi:type I polyketide synthase [Sodalis sp. dw_96]|uniref:type I polyketide synthase n=1 Tax=Sodalis sp. dw_96 TaxID=2719794 RepID=UPI001BD2C289|nr:type I polyketide synthase [Sodalis sp. dw_96]